MNLKILKLAVPYSINFIIAFVILIFLLMQLHQLLHHVAGGILCGKVGYLTFDRHHFSSDLSDSAYKIATITAPLFSHYIAMWIGLFLLADKQFNLLGFSLIFASLPLARLAAVNGGDERFYGLWICQFFGIDLSYATVISLIIILFIIVPPLIAGFISIANKRRLITFFSFLFLPLLFYFIFIWYPDHRFIVPQVIESYETGKSSNLALRLFWGLPLTDIFITLVLSVLFFGKYYRYIVIGGDKHKTRKVYTASSMEYIVINAENFNSKSWSGGTTTELFIFPLTADYQQRNFKFRLSTATVETEKSDFTSLPGISRKLMVLAGNIILSHEGHYSRQLNKFDVDEFDGDWKTSSIGKCIDFNLMTTGKTTGKLTPVVIEKDQNVNCKIKENCDLFFIFMNSGKVRIEIECQITTINKGDLLILNNLTINNLEINGIQNSELIFSEITL